MLLNICKWLNIDQCFHLKWNFCFTLVPDITLLVRDFQLVNVKRFPPGCGLKSLDMSFWSISFNSFGGVWDKRDLDVYFTLRPALQAALHSCFPCVWQARVCWGKWRHSTASALRKREIRMNPLKYQWSKRTAVLWFCLFSENTIEDFAKRESDELFVSSIG